MKIKRILIALFILLLQLSADCYGLEWKRLHEEADRLDLNQALQLVEERPDSIEYLYIVGLVYLNIHRDKQAQDTFRYILELDNKVSEAEWGVAESLRRQHQLEESEKILNRVMKSQPNFYPAYISLAYLKYTQMDFKGSLNLAYKVLAQDQSELDLSNYVRAYLLVAGNKGMLAHYGGPLSKIANGTAVLPNLRKAQRLQPDSAGVLFGLGSFYFLAPTIAGGNKDKALEYLHRAIEIDPLFADAYVRLAQIYRMKNEPDKYKIYIKKAEEIDPDNILLLDMKNNRCRFICISIDN